MFLVLVKGEEGDGEVYISRRVVRWVTWTRKFWFWWLVPILLCMSDMRCYR